MQTQWIVGSNGPTGLNYVPLFHCMDRMELESEAFEDLFSCVQVIERAALSQIHSKDE